LRCEECIHRVMCADYQKIRNWQGILTVCKIEEVACKNFVKEGEER